MYNVIITLSLCSLRAIILQGAITDENMDELIDVSEQGLTHPYHVHVHIVLLVKCPYIERESCLLYTSPSPRDATLSRMPSSA